MSKSLTKAKENQLAALMGADVGAGLENTDKDSVAIPFLRVVQRNSPQCDEADAAFMEDAKAGQFIESVNNTLFDGKAGVTLLPCAFQRRILRWGPRGDGGFKGELMPEDVTAMISAGKADYVDGRLYVKGPDGEINIKRDDRLVDTRMHFCLLETDSGPIQVLLSLSSTQIKKSKQLLAMLTSVKVGGHTPPTWMNRVKVTTVAESNDQGSWYGVKFELDGFIDDKAVYDFAKQFHDTVSAGEVEYNHEEGGEKEVASDAF
jgi:hypothetical protein